MKTLLLLIFIPMVSVATEVTHDSWYGFFTKAKLTKNYSWWTETQLRYDLDDSRMQQTLVRTGLLRKSSWGEFGLLYAYIEAGENKEHRAAFQHVSQYGEALGLSFSHRMRLEWRSREDASNLAERYRYLLRGEKPLSSNIKGVVWDEVFVNLRTGTPTGSQVVERNRLFVGANYKLSDEASLEFGYLNQFVPRSSGDVMEHVLVGYLFF